MLQPTPEDRAQVSQPPWDFEKCQLADQTGLTQTNARFVLFVNFHFPDFRGTRLEFGQGENLLKAPIVPLSTSSLSAENAARCTNQT